jgi:WD40 repeat protein
MARSSLTTLKSHQGSITCLETNSKILLSGAEDGTLKIWDMQTYKLLKTLKVGTSEASYSLCVSLNLSLGFAVGLLNKTVKFY